MFQRKPRRFRHRSNGRGHRSHGHGLIQTGARSNSFSNGQTRNNFRPTQSAEKLFEKYSALAKEAMSSGDKTLCENFLQHADHFVRIIEDKNKNKYQNQSKANIIDKSIVNNERPSENIDIEQEDATKKKE